MDDEDDDDDDDLLNDFNDSNDDGRSSLEQDHPLTKLYTFGFLQWDKMNFLSPYSNEDVCLLQK